MPDDEDPGSTALDPTAPRLPGPGWGRDRLASVAPELVDAVGFDHAPKRLRSERLPTEVRAAFEDLWDAITAEAIEHLRDGANPSLRSRTGRNALWKRLRKIVGVSQQITVHLGYLYPLSTGPWGHRAIGSLGSGGIAAGEQLTLSTAMFTGPSSAVVVAVAGAVMTEMLEVYVVTSARVERYRHAARRPSAATIAADVGSIYTNGDVSSRTADRRVVEEALGAMLERVIGRSQWRFAEFFALGVGPIVAGGMTATRVAKAQRPALREPDEMERGRPYWSDPDGDYSPPFCT